MDYRSLMVATDGSESATRAVDAAGRLAARLGAEVIVITVVGEPGDGSILPELQELAHAEHVTITRHDVVMQTAQATLERAAARLRELGVAKVETRVEIGDPGTQLVEAARRDRADLIVVGRRGLGRLGGLLLGSVSYKVVQLADMPCLTVP